MLTTRQKHIAQVLGCLTLVYISWGSCFISIKFAIESFPPFMMCGLRMMLAGVLLYLWSWARGERNLPTRKDLSQSFVLAFFMVFMASGFLAKGQESISSGTAAMILGAVPIWMVLGGWLFCGDPRPSLVQFFGLGTGFAGLILLTVNQTASGTDSGWGILLVLCAAFGWVTGSFLSKKQASETQLSVIQTSGLLMFIGGLQSLVGAAVLGEFSTFSMNSVTPLSAGALLYLVIFGAIIAYTCYFWLLLHTRTVVAISYEYVNPVIGVFLGWLLAGEQVDGVIVTACCLTVLSVFFIVSRKHGWTPPVPSGAGSRRAPPVSCTSATHGLSCSRGWPAGAKAVLSCCAWRTSIPTVPEPSTPTRSSAICAGSGWTGTRARMSEDRQGRIPRAPAWSCTRTP